MVFRNLINEIKVEETCKICRGEAHKVVSIKPAVSAETLTRLTSLASPEESRLFFQKRNAVLTIFGSGNLLINPLTMQCPLCGVLVSLGHFNEVIQSGDKIYAHIDAVHNNKKSSNRGMGYTILQRHTEYRNNNRKCDTPQLIVCTSDKVHGIKDVQVMGTSSKVKSPFDLTKVESKFTFKGIKTCEEEGCTVLDVTRKCSAEEFGNLFKTFLPHVRVNENNQLVSFKPNTSLQVLDIENATKNG